VTDNWRRLDFFAGLDPAELDVFEQKVLLRRYRARQIIFLEGEPGNLVGFLLSGKVRLYRMSEEGREKTIHILKPGDILGESAYLDGGDHPVTAESLEESHLALFRHSDFRQLLNEHPHLALHIVEKMNIRLRQAYRQIRNLALKDTYARTTSRLFKLARDHGVSTDSGILLNLSLTQSDLANMVGTSRETVSRILNDLQRKGIIEMKRSKITILDPERLRRYT